jgi:RNA recognition motif-containing protein
MPIDETKPENLLLCHLETKERTQKVSEAFLQDLFAPFGPIINLIVLRTAPRLQTLLQFYDHSSAEEALNTLSDANLSFATITLIHPSQSQLNAILTASRQSSGFSVEIYKMLDLDYPKKSPRDSSETGSMNISSNGIQERKTSTNARSYRDMTDSRGSICSQTILSPSALWYPPPVIDEKVETFLSDNHPFHDSPLHFPPRGSNAGNALTKFHSFLQTTIEKSSLLVITSLNTRLVGPKILMNLCCCFGNVSKLIIDPSLGSALIQYNSHNEALEAERCLSERVFFGLLLNAELVGGFHLQFSRKAASSMTRFQPLHGDYTFYRYQDNLNIKYNAPTNTLHLTNIASSCDQVILFIIVSQVREPTRIIRLIQRGKGGSLMYLVVFESAEHAMEVLAVLHNKVIDGKSIKASFSRPRK